MSNVQPQAAPHSNQYQMNIRPPDAFDFTKPETWPAWEKRFLRYISVANLTSKTSEEKRDLLCYTMGVQSEEILLRILPDNDASFEEILKAFRDHFVPKKNIIHMRFLFNSRVQLTGESVDAFITALYSLADDCDYSTLKEDLIRDRIVIGIRDGNTSERLKLKSDLTLAKAIQEVRQAEAQAKESELNRTVTVTKKKHGHSKVSKEFRPDHENCYRCGFPNHLEREPCPARNSTCRNCRQYGHWDKVCGLKKVHSSAQGAKALEDLENASARVSIWHDSGKQFSIEALTSRASIMDVDDVGLRAVATSSERFGCRFFHMLAKSNPDQNLVTSSLSVQILLAMAAYGAEGQTATEMNTALQLPRDTSLAQTGYYSLITTMNDETEVELRIANGIFVASYVDVKPAYKKLTKTRFLSSTEQVNFRDSKAAANAINTWCERQTNKRITKIVDPTSLGSDTAFILVNAVYFKGQWRVPFQNLFTKQRPFHIDPKTIKLVPVMKLTDSFRSGDLPKLDAKFIKIPYKGDKLSMIIILPNTITGLKKVQDNLHYVNLRQSLEQVDTSITRHVTLYLPKFKIECTFDLQPILEKLGITTAFRPTADFSGIADTPLYLNEAVQTAFIDVNETGTEAAAVFSLRGGGLCNHTIFRVDRPFYFAIYHHQTEVSLFSGIVKNPTYA